MEKIKLETFIWIYIPREPSVKTAEALASTHSNVSKVEIWITKIVKNAARKNGQLLVGSAAVKVSAITTAAKMCVAVSMRKTIFAVIYAMAAAAIWYVQRAAQMPTLINSIV